MLRIDHPRARSRETEPGADPGFPERQRSHPLRRRNPRADLSLDRAGARSAGVSPGGWATLTRKCNSGLLLAWTEITGGAPLLALFEKGPAEPPDAPLIAYCAPSAPSPPAPPSLDKLVSSREPAPPPLHSPNSRLAAASCARVPPKAG